MSILTEEDIRAAWASTKLGLDVDEVVAFAQVLESALMRKLDAMRVNGLMEMEEKIEAEILAKLAGMELPEPDDRFVFSGLDWHRATPEYFKQSQGQTNCIAAYSAAQLHQAYAQGAASAATKLLANKHE